MWKTLLLNSFKYFIFLLLFVVVVVFSHRCGTLLHYTNVGYILDVSYYGYFLEDQITIPCQEF